MTHARGEMLSQHDAYDVLSAEGLRAWQMLCCDKICGTQPKLRNEPVFAGDKKITPVGLTPLVSMGCRTQRRSGN